MFEHIRTLLLKALRVPLAPTAPAGAPGSLRSFRAGRRYYQFRLARWAVAQVAALVGILFSLGFFQYVRNEAAALRNPPAESGRPTPTAPTAPAPETASPAAPSSPAAAEPASAPSTTGKKARSKSRQRDVRQNLSRVAERTPPWVFSVMTVVEILVLAGFIASLPVTYTAVRLDYELRWYLVTDRSLRIREGIYGLHEMTMSFANLQQVEVTQGPLQRLLGIADVRVQSAGGGGDESGPDHRRTDSLHTAVFHGVDNATEIRDLILERLRLFREAGLGDPDDTAASTPPDSNLLHQAVLTLLEETRLLRSSWESRRSGP